MIRNFCKVRKGTQPLTAMKKVAKIARDYILSNSKRLKVEETIIVEFRRIK